MTFLRRQVGERNMRELLFSGELIDAPSAKEIGLVNRVVAPEDVMNENRPTLSTEPSTTVRFEIRWPSPLNLPAKTTGMGEV